ncbi:type II secretion system protein M (GspM) [Arsukibacterium tuosuense]|uniref:Type II secretion system protein M n=1 Tax=Arsukibacterium tuosuense TaxID=1323745 RepID=A0A285JHM5_9GAMM|nr:type II secretion system protein M [Arsukibacterium tuosuense]SNY59317.1 type II secretion system protein M (GspM) [Arsukibacterium tuosuense]
MKQQMQNWWAGLASREQRLVSIAAVVLGVGALYWFIWQPLQQGYVNKRVALTQAQLQLAKLQQALPQLQQAGASEGRVGGSLAQIVSNSSRTYNIRVSRMQPQNEQLQLVLEDVPFEQLLRWLAQLQSKNGVKLVSLDVANTDSSGIVRVRRMVIE